MLSNGAKKNDVIVRGGNAILKEFVYIKFFKINFKF